MKKVAIPQTDSIRELAAFWDTHDLTDFEDQLEEVEETVFDGATVVPVPLDKSQSERLQKMANTRGITLSALLQEWVSGHIRQQ